VNAASHLTGAICVKMVEDVRSRDPHIRGRLFYHYLRSLLM
jgi:hypothetical protein